MDLDASDGAPRFLPEAADTLPGDFHYSDKFFGDGASSTVEAAAVYNGMIVFGGGFEAAGSLIASGIAGWDGARWVSLGSGGSGDPSNLVFALTVWNGSLIAGGQFQAMNGVPARNIARWDGTTWSAVGGGMSGGFTTAVFALASYH